MGVLDYFIGTVQSKYAGIAMFAAVIAISLMILLTDTEISIGNRIAIVFLMVLMAAFPILISLFELTCIVTGGKKNSRYNLCHIFAWFVTVIIIIYCFMLIISAILSIFTYKKAIDKIEKSENANKISQEDANQIAKNMLEQFTDDEEDKIEYFEQEEKSKKEKFTDSDLSSYKLPSTTTEMIAMTMPGVAALAGDMGKNINKFTNMKEHFENEISGYNDDSEYMELNNQDTSFQAVPKTLQENTSCKKSQQKVEAFSPMGMENFSNI